MCYNALKLGTMTDELVPAFVTFAAILSVEVFSLCGHINSVRHLPWFINLLTDTQVLNKTGWHYVTRGVQL